MRAAIAQDILSIHADDVPAYKKGGSVVRNSYFWALKSISCHARRDRPWEFDAPVWVALGRMLMAFTEAGYLSSAETCLEFPYDTPIPPELRLVATWVEES
ncbi:hypothetical protein VB712_08820 [Spirulina sp. CCNP1310]|uniref:hypothetical protein n=1 Tax=Spirulina sp. CCNP1310 TaxID=3110249 RepID=UPI002B21F761|nr:hypothetical protein [Spirulina sp. CCNP1310]MEA5419328.1 hypothetical protein [Spirulina sp. CCNP1310]